MASTPNFAATPAPAGATLTLANTNRDGTGTLGTVITGASGGTRIDRVRIKCQGTSTAGMVRLFLFNASAAFVSLEEEVIVTAVTPAANVKTFEAELTFGAGRPLVLPNGWTLRAGTHNAETYNVVAHAANL